MPKEQASSKLLIADQSRPCKLCGRPIIFARNDVTGGIIPLDIKAQTYVTDGRGKCKPAKSRTAYVFVSHFATCSHANEFSHKGKKNQDDTSDDNRPPDKLPGGD
jgi:hypothetical protein